MRSLEKLRIWNVLFCLETREFLGRIRRFRNKKWFFFEFSWIYRANIEWQWLVLFWRGVALWHHVSKNRKANDPNFCMCTSITPANTDCCRKKAVCIGDQLLHFSVPGLFWSQSTFSTYSEVLQNCTDFSLCSSACLAVGECSPVMGLTPCMLCVQIYCMLGELDYYLLNSQLWIQDWVGLCFGNLCVCWVLLRVWLPQTISLHKLLKFSTQK